MSETSPTPWRVEADTYVDSRHSGDTEGEFLAGWNIHAADGTEIVGCEGILGDGEAAANRIVQAVNCRAEMVEALQACRSELASIHGMHGNYQNALEHSSALRLADAALARATQTNTGE